jgi:uncharacterized protein (DUF697 family)/predicted GTPase
MFNPIRKWFSSASHRSQLQRSLEHLRHRTPVPVIWLYGKTQSGKTSIIKYLTGAETAEIGQGFRPCTRFSREYQFPTAEAPLLKFLDTRGIEEPGYDPAEDLARFNPQAHVILVTAKALDHAQERILDNLRKLRQARPSRPVVLALTCLHEAYPQQQHPEPYPFTGAVPASGNGDDFLSPLRRSLAEQQRRFEGLTDRVVPIDLTQPEEGFADPNYGGEQLKQTLLEVLPGAYRQTLITLDEATRELQDLYARHALPRIIGYSTLAASAGAIPIPWVDLLILPGIQTRMIYHLAQFYGQPLTAQRFLELSSSLGLGVMVRQASRELAKLIPVVGSVAGGIFAGASTFALGKAFCYYYRAVHQGHVPRPEDLRQYYQDQLGKAAHAWQVARQASAAPGGAGPAAAATGQ